MCRLYCFSPYPGCGHVTASRCACPICSNVFFRCPGRLMVQAIVFWEHLVCSCAFLCVPIFSPHFSLVLISIARAGGSIAVTKKGSQYTHPNFTNDILSLDLGGVTGSSWMLFENIAAPQRGQYEQQIRDLAWEPWLWNNSFVEIGTRECQCGLQFVALTLMVFLNCHEAS